MPLENCIGNIGGSIRYNASRYPVLEQILCRTNRKMSIEPPKSDFVIDLDKGSVTCKAGITIGIRPKRTLDGGRAAFGKNCSSCYIVSQCTKSKSGRTIQISPFEQQLQQARLRFADPAFRQDYREIRPKVERKLAHLTRRLHGGRKARVRGITKVTADFLLLVAAQNLARLAILGVIPPESPHVVPI